MPDEVVYPKFQSTLLQEERHVDRTWSDHFFCISIHHPTRGATKSSLKWMISVYDFNPRSYKRSDYLFNFCCFYAFLSIHAPTRGATKQRWLKLFGGYLSIHAPTRGATFPPNASLTFSSLSIHAPTRGATLQGRQF